MRNANIFAEKSPEYFFKENLESVLYERNFPASKEAVFHVSSIMAKMLDADYFYKKGRENLGEKPLAFVFGEAICSDRETKYQKLKSIGDFSLVMSGFFQENLKRKRRPNLINYYTDMGRFSYNELSKIVFKNNLRELFFELYSHFSEFRDALRVISVRTRLNSNEKILDFFQEYFETNDKILESELSKRGFSLKVH